MRSLPALALLATIAACTTPTIPIPPPQTEDATFALDTAAGTATFEYAGGVDYADLYVYIFNLTRGDNCMPVETCEDIAMTDATGHVLSSPFTGVEDDLIDIVFRRGDDAIGFCLLLRNGQSNDNNLCP